MNEYELKFLEFVKSYPRAEVVDTIENAPLKTKNADYFFEDRKIVAELKVFEDNFNDKILKKIVELIKRHRIKPVVRNGRVKIGDVLAEIEKNDDVIRELFKQLTSSLEDSFEKANRQIRETKVYFSLPNAMGLVFLCNYKNRLLLPSLVIAKLLQLVRKRSLSDSELPRYGDIQAVIFITEQHSYIGNEEAEIPIITIPIAETAEHEALLQDFNDEFVELWAKHRGVDFSTHDTVLSPDEISNLNFREIE